MARKSAPRVIVLRAPGTNCDEETVAAWQLAGAIAETWHVERLLESPHAMDQFQILTIPGGSNVEVSGCTAGWCQVTFQGQYGYVIATSLDQGNGPPPSAATAPPPPPPGGTAAAPPPRPAGATAPPPPGYAGPPPSGPDVPIFVAPGPPPGYGPPPVFVGPPPPPYYYGYGPYYGRYYRRW